ncbi:hypothetical protein M8009_12975 [Halomonas sp. ATCH28]|uniref:Uncharacterized protein n=1 Tax=Halomonas gemina TaxID=2945105 RepID=A0ABT0T2U9_9GAMM|nr:hypothetical protein [Halomonas gemina]MCL7941199.1 hypothetical protein [Halomonas gemina]
MSELSIPKNVRELIHDLAFVEVREARQLIMEQAIEGMTKQEVGEAMIHLVELVEQVIGNAEEHAIGMLIAEGGMHPHQAEKINFPCLKGAALGLVAAERVPADARHRLCAGCAYHQGSVANQCMPTQTDVEWTLKSGEGFNCHINGYDEATDTATQPCVGHLHAKRGAE